MNLPDWITDPSITAEERTKCELRYRLILAAAFHNKYASVSKLGKAAGFSGQHLTNCINRAELPVKVGLAIEGLVGRDIFCREMFKYL